MPTTTPSDIKNIIVKQLPAIDQHDDVVEHVSDGALTIRVPFRPEYLGTDVWGDAKGVVYSGPMVMGLADTAMYACLHASYGRAIVPVIVSLTITFLEPALARDLIAKARVVRRGGRLAYLETSLFSDDNPRPVAHVTATYAIRHQSSV